mmetsp:Transcript_27026/g.43441  ORF Transcript_27026/g.43441 Transcript_27026/m.43441 type:complete len:135 (+) Transcript_27026:542-946(+)
MPWNSWVRSLEMPYLLNQNLIRDTIVRIWDIDEDEYVGELTRHHMKEGKNEWKLRYITKNTKTKARLQTLVRESVGRAPVPWSVYFGKQWYRVIDGKKNHRRLKMLGPNYIRTSSYQCSLETKFRWPPVGSEKL